MFNLDELELDLSDEIFDIFPKKLKSDDGSSSTPGKLSFGIENTVVQKPSAQIFIQSSFSSPPNILSHLNKDRNIEECKKYFSQATKASVHQIISPIKPRIFYEESTQSPSYSPITSTQKPMEQNTNFLFDKTNVLSPIRMRPGILSDIRKVTTNKAFNQTTKSRKFPGPAGCLPDIGPNEDFTKVSLSSLNIDKEEKYPTNSRSITNVYDNFNSSSQLNDSETWSKVKSAIGLECWPLFDKYRINNLLTMITQPNGLPNFKIPVACLSLVDIEYLPRDSAATMSDSSGSIRVAIHRHVLQHHRDKIKVGSIFILKKVSVFSPSGKKYFLNITESNIVDIFCPGDSDNETHCHPILSVQSVNALIGECACRSDLVDFDPGTATTVTNVAPGNIDFFDDDMDEEFASLMDESFPS